MNENEYHVKKNREQKGFVIFKLKCSSFPRLYELGETRNRFQKRHECILLGSNDPRGPLNCSLTKLQVLVAV